MVPYTAALEASNCANTLWKSIRFGVKKLVAKNFPAAGGHLHTVSLRVENGRT